MIVGDGSNLVLTFHIPCNLVLLLHCVPLRSLLSVARSRLPHREQRASRIEVMFLCLTIHDCQKRDGKVDCRAIANHQYIAVDLSHKATPEKLQHAGDLDLRCAFDDKRPFLSTLKLQLVSRLVYAPSYVRKMIQGSASLLPR